MRADRGPWRTPSDRSLTPARKRVLPINNLGVAVSVATCMGRGLSSLFPRHFLASLVSALASIGSCRSVVV